MQVSIPDFDMRHHTVLVTRCRWTLGKYHWQVAHLELECNVIATDLSLDNFSDLQTSEIVSRFARPYLF